MKFKVCCISSVHEAEMAIAAGAWAIGLVAAMPSAPGPIADTRIRAIAAAARGRARRFLLTARTDAKAIIAHIRFCNTDSVQLVDATTPAVRAAIRQACPGVTIVQVVHVRDQSSIAGARAAAQHSDMVLLDSGRPDGLVRELGGTGRTHDWTISAQIVRTLACPVILAGGLNPGNAIAAAKAVRPFALDLCTGLRGEDFALNAEKLAAFAAVVKTP